MCDVLSIISLLALKEKNKCFCNDDSLLLFNQTACFSYVVSCLGQSSVFVIDILVGLKFYCDLSTTSTKYNVYTMRT